MQWNRRCSQRDTHGVLVVARNQGRRRWRSLKDIAPLPLSQGPMCCRGPQYAAGSRWRRSLPTRPGTWWMSSMSSPCRTRIPEPTSCSPCARPPTPSTDWGGPLTPPRWPAPQLTAPSGEPAGTRVFWSPRPWPPSPTSVPRPPTPPAYAPSSSCTSTRPWRTPPGPRSPVRSRGPCCRSPGTRPQRPAPPWRRRRRPLPRA